MTLPPFLTRRRPARPCRCEADPAVFGHTCPRLGPPWRVTRLRWAEDGMLVAGVSPQPAGADGEPGDLYGPELD